MLACHEKGNHHVGNLAVGNGCAVLVLAVPAARKEKISHQSKNSSKEDTHQVPYHILFSGLRRGISGLTSLLDDGHVRFGHLLLRIIASPVLWKRCPWQHKVDRGEAHVEVVVEIGKGRVELVANLLALQRAAGSVDGQFGKSRRQVHRATARGKSLVDVVLGEELARLFGDQGDIGLQSRGSQAEFDKLVT